MIRMLNEIKYGRLHPQELVNYNNYFDEIKFDHRAYNELIYFEFELEYLNSDFYNLYNQVDESAIYICRYLPGEIDYKSSFSKFLNYREITDPNDNIETCNTHIWYIINQALMREQKKVEYWEMTFNDDKKGFLKFYIGLMTSSLTSKESGIPFNKLNIVVEDLQIAAMDFLTINSFNDLNLGYQELLASYEYFRKCKVSCEPKFHKIYERLELTIDEIVKKYNLRLEELNQYDSTNKNHIDKTKNTTYTIEFKNLPRDRKKIVYEELKNLFNHLFPNIKNPSWFDFKSVFSGNAQNIKIVWTGDEAVLNFVFRKLHQHLKFSPKKWEAVSFYFVPDENDSFDPKKLEGNTHHKNEKLEKSINYLIQTLTKPTNF